MSLRRSLLSILLVAAACSEGESPSSGFGSSQTGITSATTATTATTSTATDAASTGDASGDTAPTGDPSGTSSTTSTSTSTSTTAVNPGGLPNASECTADDMCESGNCFEITIPVDSFPPGVCAPCDEDADCVAAGTGISCTIDAEVLSAKCTDGGLGSFCQSQAGCQPDLFCDLLIEGSQGLLPMACNECRTDDDCGNGLRCVAKVDVVMYTGHKYCAAPGSVVNDGLCPLDGGDAMCLSAHCGLLDLGGVLQVGVCGQCGSDADCAMGQVCSAPKFDSGFFGSECM